MKIGIDARIYGPKFTGIGRYNVELVDHLAQLDDKNEYVVFLQKEQFDQFTTPNRRFTKVLADFPHYSFGEQLGFNSLLKSHHLDLMHFTHFNAPIRYNRPYVVTIHDLTLSFFKSKKSNFIKNLAYKIIIRRVTREAKQVIAISENTKKDLIETLGLPEEKISMIYNGINPKFGQVNPTPRQDLMKKLNLQQPYLLYTGVWRRHKNLVSMVKAFAKFNKGTKENYNLVITGKHSPLYDEVPNTIHELGIQDQVHLVGMVSEEDLFGLYKNALAYVFPSFYEGFGLPPLEAMQCGIPVIASNTSATPEVCGEGNALFFDPYDVEDMQVKMKQIATDPTLRDRLIKKGYERVKEFDWGKMTKKVLGVYKKIYENVK